MALLAAAALLSPIRGRAEPAIPPEPRPAAVLRVGVVDGSPPCSDRVAGEWQGLPVEIWYRIATRERLPFVLSEWPSVQAMLAATRRGDLDVAVGCINVSPERLESYRFTLPFQEDGLAVMVVRSRLDLGRAFLGSLLGPTLLQLLGGFLLIMVVLTLITWRVEGYGQHPDTRIHGRRRSLCKVFQVLVTGPGGNTLVHTTRGNAVVIVAYLVRIVAASLLVGFLTVNVVRETQEKSSGRIRSLEDLRGLRVAVRPGTVSADLLRELDRSGTGPRVIPVPLPSINQALPLLEQGRVDAVLADNLQLSFLLHHSRDLRFVPSLVLQGIRPESQAFALSPALPESTVERIDLAISALKRNGVISELRQRTTGLPQRDRAQGAQAEDSE